MCVDLVTTIEKERQLLQQPTLEKLYNLRLSAMAEAWEQQARTPKVSDLSFDERFGMLVEAEHLARENRKLQRLLRDADFRMSEACMEDVKPAPERGLPQAKLRQLGQGAWIGEHLNILLTGATGVGKSFIACALGQLACRRGHRVTYRRLSPQQIRIDNAPRPVAQFSLRAGHRADVEHQRRGLRYAPLGALNRSSVEHRRSDHAMPCFLVANATPASAQTPTAIRANSTSRWLSASARMCSKCRARRTNMCSR